MDSLINRQAAIDAIGKASDELYENIKKGATFPQRQWFDGMAQAQSILENLPSTQPEQDILGWLLAYHTKSFDLNGRYMAHEVIGWLVHDFANVYMTERREE